ncbi:MAG: CpaF family protein [Acidimicrobiales bacterium]
MTSDLERRLVAEVRAGLGTAVEHGGLSAMDRRALAGKLIADGLQREAGQRIAAGTGPLTSEEEDRATRFVLDRIFLAGGLQVYLDDPSVMELNAQGCDEVFVRYVDGRTERVDQIADSDEALVELVRTLGREGMAERRFDAGCPRVSVQLPNGDRLFAAMAVCPRPVVSIRRHDFEHLATLDDQLQAGMIDLGLKELEAAAVRARKNIVVSGATGAGKTTHTRALANEIPSLERIVTIEDCLELNLHRFSARHPQVVAFQEREANVEGEGAVSMAELVRWSLRLSPDRVIVGEVRGPEVIPMLLAMTMGTDGSLCTIHASSSKGAFGKLATYAAMAPERLGLEAANLLIAGAVHFIVHIAQRSVRGEKTRRFVSSVREVTGAEGPHVVSNEIYSPGPDGRAVPAAPLRGETLEELEAAGFDRELLAQPGGWWQ